VRIPSQGGSWSHREVSQIARRWRRMLGGARLGQPASVPASVSLQRLPEGLVVRWATAFSQARGLRMTTSSGSYAKNQASLPAKAGGEARTLRGRAVRGDRGRRHGTSRHVELRVRNNLATGRVAFFDPAALRFSRRRRRSGRSWRDRQGERHAARAKEWLPRPTRRLRSGENHLGLLNLRVRPRPLAAQRHHLIPFLVFKPRLGHPLATLPSAIRRSARGSRPSRRALSTPSATRGLTGSYDRAQISAPGWRAC